MFDSALPEDDSTTPADSTGSLRDDGCVRVPCSTVANGRKDYAGKCTVPPERHPESGLMIRNGKKLRPSSITGGIAKVSRADRGCTGDSYFDRVNRAISNTPRSLRIRKLRPNDEVDHAFICLSLFLNLNSIKREFGHDFQQPRRYSLRFFSFAIRRISTTTRTERECNTSLAHNNDLDVHRWIIDNVLAKLFFIFGYN